MVGRPPASVLTILGALIEERIGLHYRMEESDLFWSKVATRMDEAGFQSALDYYYFLRYDDPTHAELDALIDVLVVGETYLFREIAALRAAFTHVVKPAIEQRGHARIWSAASSTGEEPFTIAMLAAQEGILPAVDIYATDVSERSILRARAGHLSHRALRALETEPELTDRWMTKSPEERFALSPIIHEKVRFERLNLMDSSRIRTLEPFDLIVCRNVLIYFRDAVVQKVIASLATALRPRGRLLVGASESLLRFGTALAFEERGGAFFYAKEAKEDE